MGNALLAVLLVVVMTDMIRAQSLTDRLQQLQRGYASSYQAWRSQYDDVGANDGSIARYRNWPGWSFAPKFIAFADSHEQTQEGFDALMEVLKMGRSVSPFDRELFHHYEHAIELMLTKHLDRVQRTVCANIGVSDQCEKFLRTLINEGKSKEIRAEACLRLGRLLAQKSEMCMPDSWAKRPGVGVFGEYTDARTRENLTRFLADHDVEQLRSDAIRVLELVVSDYPDVLAMQGDEKLSVLATREIYELKHLAIGVTAPEIKGSDLDGKAMRLSDHRGKVVLLVFWASTCGPCIGDIPHEIELHAKFAGRPFAIVGVNADSTLESARVSVEQNMIPWRSFWNGVGGVVGPITTDWNVRVWPTVYVLDHEGKIRFKNLRRNELDEPIEQLVKQAERIVPSER